jgi:flagellin-like protein
MGYMKANKKYILEEDEGVSAVIGVILMVAITVAIAATVYVYVSGMMGTGGEQPPTIIWSVNENMDRLEITRTDPNVAWEDLQFRSSQDVNVMVNNQAVVDTGAVTANTLYEFVDGDIATGTITTTIAPSDFISIGSNGATKNNVEVRIIHIESGSTIGTYSFTTIADIS